MKIPDQINAAVTWFKKAALTRLNTGPFPGTAAVILYSLIVAVGTSCNPEEWGAIDCSECYSGRPAEAEIHVRLTIDDLNPSVEINVYSGRIEEEILILSGTSTATTWSAILPADEYYTVTATYRSRFEATGNVTAIDGSHLRTRHVRTSCDEPCWTVQGKNFNVRLRY
jgi:hypothetical protein